MAIIDATVRSQLQTTENASFQTPSATPPALLTLPEEDFVSLRFRWKQAVAQWEQKLVDSQWKNHPHKLAIAKFQSWQDLMDDLKRRAQGQAHGFIERMIPSMRMIRKVFPVFVAAVAIPSQSPEVSLMWGVLYLGVTAVSSSVDASREMPRIIDKLDSKMAQFDRLSLFLMKWSANEDSNREVARAVVDLFEAIINFWTKAVVVLKGDGRRVWPGFLNEADEALQSVSDAVERVQSLVTSLQVEANFRSQSQLEAAAEASLISVDRTEFPCHYLPTRRGFFHGRADMISVMTDHLVVQEPCEDLWSVAVYGMPGVGKTAGALHFAYMCVDKQHFDAILWIKAENEMSCKSSFTEIARKLELVRLSGPQDHDISVLAVKNWLRKTAHSWLVIYDNVEDSVALKEFLPDAPGPILITTRYYPVAIKVPGLKKYQEILPFDESNSLAMLSGFRNQYHHADAKPRVQNIDSTEDMRRLAEVTGGLALGIEHMAAYIENDRLSVRQFLEAYNKMAAHIHKRDDTGSNAPYTIKTLWELGIERSKRDGPDSYRFLQILSLLAPSDISLQLFNIEEEEGWDGFDEDLADILGFSESYLQIATAIETLQKHALIQRSGDTISIHRLLQESVYLSLTIEEQRKVFRGAVQLLYFAFPRQAGGEHLSDKWTQCNISIQHVLLLADKFVMQSKKPKTKLPTCPELQELMANAAWYLFETGEHQTALSLVEKGWKMCPDPDNSLHYAHLCNTAGVLHFEWNDLSKSAEMHRLALKIRARVMKEANVFVGYSHFNIGQVHSALGHLDEALEELETTKKIFEAIGLLDDKKDRGLFMMVYGRVFFLRGDLKEAREVWEDSLRSLVETFPEGSMLTAYMQFNFGNLSIAEKNIVEAQNAFNDGFALADKLAPTHALAAAFHFKLGFLQSLYENYKSALFHCDKGLAIADLRKLKGDRVRLLYLKATCLENQVNKAGVQENTAEHTAIPTPGVEAAMQKLTISKGPDDDSQKSVSNTIESFEQTRKMAESEKDHLLISMGKDMPSGIPEAEVYDRLCCLYHR